MREARKSKKLEIRQKGSGKPKHTPVVDADAQVHLDEQADTVVKRKKVKAKRETDSELVAKASLTAGAKAQKILPDEPPAKRVKKKKESTPDVDETMETSAAISSDPEAFKVVAAGIPKTVTEQIIRRDFSECGEILSLRLLKDRETGDSRGIAFISFTSQAALEAALKYNGDDYGGRTLVVQVADKGDGKKRCDTEGKSKGKGSEGPGEKPIGCTSVIIKGLAYSVTEADLINTFKKCGKGPANVKMLTDRDTGASRGMAFIDFDNESAVDEAIALNGTELKGRRFSMDYATPREKSIGPGTKPAGCTCVLVKGLAYSVTDNDLGKVFKSCGDGPTNIRIIKNKETGTSRGMAFVDFADEGAVDEAIKLHGTELQGRRFIMEYAGKVNEEEKAEKGAARVKPPKNKPEGCTSVVLKNLALAVTEAKLMKLFKSCGAGPRNVNIPLDKETGESTGVAFINFSSEAAVEEAMQLNGTELKGQCFTVGYVKPKPREKR